MSRYRRATRLSARSRYGGPPHQRTTSQPQRKSQGVKCLVISFCHRDEISACAWCGKPIDQNEGAGRPRRYCRRSCRQRDFEARKRARELGLAESDLIVARRAMEGLDDLLFVLSCAIEDVENDLGLDPSPEQVSRSLTGCSRRPARCWAPASGCGEAPDGTSCYCRSANP